MSGPPPDPFYILRGGGSPVTAVIFGFIREEQHLFSGDDKGIIRIWNLPTKRTDKILNGHDGKSIINLQWLNDDKLLSFARDGYLLIWNVYQEKILIRLKIFGFGLCKCEVIYYSNSNISVAANSKEQSQIDILCTKSNQVLKKLVPKSSQSLGMCMCLKNVQHEELLAGYENGNLVLWNTTSAKMISKLTMHEEPVMCIDYDPNSGRGITGSAETQLKVFKITVNSHLELERTVIIKNPGVSDVKIRGDGKITATAGWDNKLRIFSWKSLKPLAILNYHTQTLNSLSFSKEQILAAASKDGRISLWSLY